MSIWTGAGAYGLRAALLLLACVAPFATAAPTLPVGRSEESIRITSASLVRWQEGDETVLDLIGGVRIVQGTTVVSAPRLLGWFREATRNGRRVGVLEVYAAKGTVLTRQGDPPQDMSKAVMFRLTTLNGMTLDAAAMWAGDRPADDAFRREAAAFRKDEQAQPLPEGIGPLGTLRVGAEAISLAEKTDQGAVLSLRGNAEVRGAGRKSEDDFIVQADTIRLRVIFRNGDRNDQTPESLYAEGAVDVRRGAQRLTADELYMDLIAETGIARKARLRTTLSAGRFPVQIYAETLREYSRDRFSAEEGGYFTMSPFAEPHYRLEAKSIDAVVGPGEHRVRRARAESPDQTPAVPEGDDAAAAKPARMSDSIVVSSHSNTFYAGDVPVGWWPYLAKDVTSGTFFLAKAEVGSSSNLGFFARTGWDLYDLGLYANDWSTMVLLADWYARRGFGSGMQYGYNLPGRTGAARVYYIDDTATDDDGTLPVEKRDRGEITWRHRETIDDLWRADFEAGYLSDRRYLRTYYPSEYDGGKDHETGVFVTRREDNSLFTAMARERVNDFQNMADKETVGYHRVGEPLFDTPLIWTTHSEVGRVRNRTDDALNVQDPNGIGRLDTAHEVSLPFLTGPVKFDPYVWGDLTGYTRQADDDASSVRAASAVGVRAATNFYRSYDTQSELFGVDRLRHIVTPKAELRDTWGVSKDPSNYIQNDEIDAVEQGTYADLGVRNRWQTYRNVGGRRTMIDLLTVDVDYIRNFQGRNSLVRTTQDYVQVGSIWRATDELTLSSEDNRYNTDMGRIDAVNGSVALDYWQPLRLGFTQKYYRDLYDAANPEHNVSIASAAWQPRWSRWKIEGNISYDFLYTKQPGDSKSNLLGAGLVFTRQLDQWSLMISAAFNQGLSNETTFSVMLLPPGIRRGGGPYSMMGY